MVKPLYRIYFLIALAALVLTLLIYVLTLARISPFQMKMISRERGPNLKSNRIYFHSLDSSGLDYRIVLVNDLEKKQYYAKIYGLGTQGLIDQYNFRGMLMTDEPGYYDFNGDGIQDVIIFSNDDDWLYISVIDAAHNRRLVWEHPLLPASPKKVKEKWDLGYFYVRIADLEGDGRDELIFNLHSGYAKYPRCLCVVSLPDLQLIRRFDHHLGFVRPVIVDLDGDGKKELALGNSATNNFPPDTSLSDAYSWQLILDHQLRPISEPTVCEEKFSGLQYLPLKWRGEEFLLMYYQRPEKKTGLALLDSSYQAHREATLPFVANSVMFNHHDTLSPIYITGKGGLYKLNMDLKIVEFISIPQVNYLSLDGEFKVREDDPPYFWARSPAGLHILDLRGKPVGFFPIKILTTHFAASQVKKSIYPDPVFYVHGGDEIHFVRLVSNPFYNYRQIAAILIFCLLLTVLMAAHWIWNRILQYITYFIYSLRRSDHAIILLDHRGRIITANRRLNRLLDLQIPLQRRQHFTTSLSKRTDIMSAIHLAMYRNRKIKKTLNFDSGTRSFIGEIVVTPFKSYFNFTTAYLVEIKDSTRAVLLERQQNWQRNIRRIVHDLKTPLAGVQLKLQAIYMNLTENNPDVDKSIFESLETAHQELIRIRNITKDFLKFSDLQQIHPQRVRLQDIITQSLQPFKLYFTESLTIDLQLEENLPEWVNWDSRQIEILLHIILENSLDALAGNGKIEFKVSFAQHDGKYPSGLLIFKIIDNGPGIPEEIQEKIFEPHFSTKQEGSGLGLTFAKHIVQSHGGNIHFTSRPTAGTIFVIELPVDALNFIRKDV